MAQAIIEDYDSDNEVMELSKKTRISQSKPLMKIFTNNRPNHQMKRMQAAQLAKLWKQWLLNKITDPILNLTPESITQHSGIE